MLSLLNRMISNKVIVTSFAFVVISFFVIHRAFVKTPGTVELVASYGLHPLIKVQKTFIDPITSFLNRKKDYQELVKNLHETQNELSQLKKYIVELEASKVFLETTHKLEKFKKRYNTEKAILAHVILQKYTHLDQTLMLDQGANHGIEKDMVVVYQNCILGKIDQVYPYYSHVITIADKRCKVAAYCQATKAVGIVQGINQTQTLQLGHVNHLKKLKKGDVVYSSGQGTVFPEGFLLGTIEDFYPEGVHHKVIVKPAVDLNAVDYCYVIKKGANL